MNISMEAKRLFGCGQPASEVKIMLLGSTGSGKSSSGNTILNRARNPFEDDFSPESVTRFCQLAEKEMDEQRITVIDTVGLYDTDVKITEAQRQIEQKLTFHDIDVFLLVIKLGETFRKIDSKVVKWIQDNLGAKAFSHSIVLFTHGDQLHGPVERYLNKCKDLRSVVNQCGGRFYVFNNRKEDKFQVTELWKEINVLRMKNVYSRYTQRDYKQTQESLLQRRCFIGAAVGIVGGALLGGLLALTALAGAVVGVNTGRVTLTAGEAAAAGSAVGALVAAVLALCAVFLFAGKHNQT